MNFKYILVAILGVVAGAMLANLLIGRKLLKTARLEVQTELTRVAPYLDRTLEDMEQFIGVMRGELSAYVEHGEKEPPKLTG